MSRGRPAARKDHRSDRLKMVYFLVSPDDGGRCKIGWGDVPQRLKAARVYGDWELHSAICGSEANEDAIQKYFDPLYVRGEMFRLEGELVEYLDWLGTRAFAAASLDTLADAWPHPNRFPWNRHQNGLVENAQLPLFDGFIAPRVRRPLSRSQKIRATLRSDSDEWCTPPLYAQAAREVMDGIDLDPASSPLANLNIQAESIYTKADDGLLYEWHGRVWLNPPYGNEKDKFVEHLLNEYRAGRVKQAVMCLNAHATDTIWFGQLWAFPICLTHHRVRFVGGASNRDAESGAPTTGTAFVYVGPNEDRFAEVFSCFGPVARCARPASTTPEQFRQLQADGLDWGAES